MNRGFFQILVLVLLDTDMYGCSMVPTIHNLGYEVKGRAFGFYLSHLSSQPITVSCQRTELAGLRIQ